MGVLAINSGQYILPAMPQGNTHTLLGPITIHKCFLSSLDKLNNIPSVLFEIVVWNYNEDFNPIKSLALASFESM